MAKQNQKSRKQRGGFDLWGSIINFFDKKADGPDVSAQKYVEEKKVEAPSPDVKKDETTVDQDGGKKHKKSSKKSKSKKSRAKKHKKSVKR